MPMISTEEYMDIIALKRQGHSLRWIAKKLGIHRKTVKKHLESQLFQLTFARLKNRRSLISITKSSETSSMRMITRPLGFSLA